MMMRRCCLLFLVYMCVTAMLGLRPIYFNSFPRFPFSLIFSFPFYFPPLIFLLTITFFTNIPPLFFHSFPPFSLLSFPLFSFLLFSSPLRAENELSKKFLMINKVSNEASGCPRSSLALARPVQAWRHDTHLLTTQLIANPL